MFELDELDEVEDWEILAWLEGWHVQTMGDMSSLRVRINRQAGLKNMAPISDIDFNHILEVFKKYHGQESA